jgi:hypothetical protein
MNKKYKLTNETIIHKGITLYRIKALRDFSNVRKGDLGGYIEKEANLNYEGDCWIYDNAKVYGNARVYRYAKVYGNAEVCGNTWICGYARVFGNTKVYGNAWVFGYAKVYGNAEVFENAKVYGYSDVSDNAKVYKDAEVFGYAGIYGDAEITKDCLNVNDLKLYQHNISFTDYHIAIGCKQMLFAEWLEVGLDDAIAMGLKEECYNNVRSLLESLIPQYYGKELA